MTADPRAVEIIRDALRESMWEGSEHPGEFFLSDRDVPGAANRIARWLADAGWSLLPPGGREALDKLRAAVDDALIYDDGAVRAAAADLASHLTEGTDNAQG